MQFNKYLLKIILLIFTSYSSYGQVVKYRASKLSNSCFNITEDTQNNAGAVWFDDKLDLSKPFTLKYVMQLGNKNAGADGVAFVMHNDPLGYEASGEAGQGLFFGDGNLSPIHKQISPSVAIEFDTYRNTTPNVPLSDPIFDHTTVVYNGAVDYPEFTAVQIHPTKADVEDATCFVAEISWDPTSKSLSLYVDGTLRFIHTDDIVINVFNATELVYFGFTGSTGGATNQQTVCIYDGNTTPTVKNDTNYFSLNTPLLAEVLENDGTSDGDEIFISKIVEHPKNGTTTISNNKSIYYIPSEGFIGKDSLKYQVSDIDSLFETKCFANKFDGWVFFNPVPCPVTSLQVEILKNNDISCVANLPNGKGRAFVSNGTSVSTDFTFKWYFGALTLDQTQKSTPTAVGQEVNELPGGIYTVVAEFVQNPTCAMLQQITVLDHIYIPEFNLVSTPSDRCNPSNGTIKVANLNFSLEDVAISWIKDGVEFANGKDSVSNLEPGVYEVRVTHGLTACTSALQTTIVNSSSVGTLSFTSVPNSRCLPVNGSLSANVNGSTEGYDFYLARYRDSNFMLANNGGYFESLIEGKYYLTATNKLSGCSTDTITAEIGSNYSFPAISVSAVSNSSCMSSNANGSAALLLNGETPSVEYQFQWFKGSGNDLIPFTNIASNKLVQLEGGFYSVQITSLVTQCVKILSFEIDNKPVPFSNAPKVSSIISCGPLQTDIVVEEEGETFKWYDKPESGSLLFTGKTLSHYFDIDTLFYVAAINGLGCESPRTEVSVKVNSVPAAPVSQSYFVCGPSAIQVSVEDEGLAYHWYDQPEDGLLLFSGHSFSSTFSKDTAFYVSSINGSCESSSRTKVEVLVYSPSDVSITQRNTSLVATDGGFAYRWFFNEALLEDTTRMIEPIEAGSYKVEVVDKNGCTAVSAPFQFAILSSEESISQSDFIYPNPASGMLHLKLGMNWDKSSYRFIDMVGKNTLSGKVAITSDTPALINVSGLTTGIYYIIIEKAGKRIVRTVAKE